MMSTSMHNMGVTEVHSLGGRIPSMDSIGVCEVPPPQLAKHIKKRPVKVGD
nr:hypothetical protein [Tanacetum cinerariifolium]